MYFLKVLQSIDEYTAWAPAMQHCRELMGDMKDVVFPGEYFLTIYS